MKILQVFYGKSCFQCEILSIAGMKYNIVAGHFKFCSHLKCLVLFRILSFDMFAICRLIEEGFF